MIIILETLLVTPATDLVIQDAKEDVRHPALILLPVVVAVPAIVRVPEGAAVDVPEAVEAVVHPLAREHVPVAQQEVLHVVHVQKPVIHHVLLFVTVVVITHVAVIVLPLAIVHVKAFVMDIVQVAAKVLVTQLVVLVCLHALFIVMAIVALCVIHIVADPAMEHVKVIVLEVPANEIK